VKDLIETFYSVLQKLEENDIPYMLVGSVASMIYGEPRMTHDMDLVVEILPRQVPRIESLFPIEEFYCPPTEIISAEISGRGQFNLIHHDSGLKIDLMIRKESEHAKTEFARRRKAPFWQGHEVYIASAEDVIIKKLDFYNQSGSEKHLRDIRGMLAHTPVDETYLKAWVSTLGLDAQWAKV
jgi:hypothetical protein